MDWLFADEVTGNFDGIVCGIDEAGRGPLAGAVYAAAVILPKGCEIPGLDDSKRLREKQRDALLEVIRETALDWAVGRAESYEIDKLNILGATMLAMRRAVALLRVRPALLLIDGSYAKGFDLPVKTVVKGDARVPAIAAASIVAKVIRDEHCRELDALYPQYRFAAHKGYATAYHRAMIKKYGPCPVHRRSFLKNIIGEMNEDEQTEFWKEG